jgi:hypothetical protein
MRSAIYIFIALAVLTGLIACLRPTGSNYPNGSSDSPSQSTGANEGLTNAKVETAVASMLSDWRLGGSVSVRGIQEIPQQNAAVADLQFNDFQYGVTTEGGLVRAKDFNPKSMPKDQSRLPTMEEMFPQRKATYSKDGKAILSRYNDGRWVLKEVRWGFDTGVKGTIEIR